MGPLFFFVAPAKGQHDLGRHMPLTGCWRRPRAGMAAVRCTESQDAHDGAPLAPNGEVYTDENGARRSERGVWAKWLHRNISRIFD